MIVADENQTVRALVVVNPAAGQDEPVLNVLNRVFDDRDIAWEVAVTHTAGEATALGRQALLAGLDLVFGYGGDGTLAELAGPLAGSDVPLVILPGGTGNGVANELGIPTDLAVAAALPFDGGAVRHIDVGRMGERVFLLHAYVGLEERHRAGREQKERYGMLAYVHAAFEAVTQSAPADFVLDVDGDVSRRTGTICLVSSASGLPRGLPLPLIDQMQLDDGLLSVTVPDPNALRLLEAWLGGEAADPGLIFQRKGTTIIVEAAPAQPIWLDGEPAGETPATFTIQPGALPVVVPAS